MGIFRWLAQKAEDAWDDYKAKTLESQPDEFEKLMQDLKNDNDGVRWRAADALGDFDDISAVPALTEALGDKDALVRLNAATALAKIAEKNPGYDWSNAAPSLVEALRDRVVNVQARVAEVLREIRKPPVPALVELLRDNSTFGGWKAAKILGNAGDVSAVPALVKALGDADMRERAVLALNMIAWKHPGYDWSIAVPALVEALGDKNTFVAWKAAEALGEIGNPAVPVLVEALWDAGVREKAAWALGKCADNHLGYDWSSAMSALVIALGDADERRNAAWALGDIPRNCDTLEGLESFGKGLSECYRALEKKYPDRDELIKVRMELAKVMKKISEEKNKLASKRDILLDAKPNPPKRGKMYQRMRRVHNG